MIQKNQILMASLGNALEWFDFGLFIFLAPTIGEKFFPSSNPTTATLAALSVFAIGFICRPLGGILFGHAGDTHGRARTLRYSIMIITLSTVLIGFLPTYQSIGVCASLLFILLRLCQGFSIGGEYSGVMIYLAESAPINKRGFITSFAAVGANVGFLSATLVLMLLGAIFSKQSIYDWAWRLPFIFIGIPGSLILYYRFQLKETPIFSHLQITHHLEKWPLLTALKQAPNQLLKILGLTCMSSTLYYVYFIYVPIYLNLNHPSSIERDSLLFIESFCLGAMLFLVPLAGICGDRFGRKRMLIITAICSILFSIPNFYLLQSSSINNIILTFIIATLLSSFDQGNHLSAVVENCPSNIRYSGIAFSYNLGMAVFGGLSPLIVTMLTQKVSFIAPAFYLMLMAAISLLAAATLYSKQQIYSLYRRS